MKLTKKSEIMKGIEIAWILVEPEVAEVEMTEEVVVEEDGVVEEDEEVGVVVLATATGKIQPRVNAINIYKI